jgi:NADH dehydrogenase FAD-containing subunit
MNNPFYSNRKNIFQLNNRNKVIVNDHLQSHKNLYVIGDNAVTPFSGLGLTAVHNASYVAKDITKKLNGHFKTSAYKPLHPATVIPVGKNWAVFEYKKIVFGGLFGGMMRSIADLVAYNDIAGTFKAIKIWFSGHQIEEDQCVLCKTQLKDDPPSILSSITQDY